jgi:hypothetical protein
MDFQDNFSSTEETVKFSRRNKAKTKHSQNKTEHFPRSCRSLFRKKKLRTSSKPTDSTSTLIEHVSISQSLNNHNLKISLKSIYENDPVAKLKEIFKTKPFRSPRHHSRETINNFSFDLQNRRRGKVDSIFQHCEADFIINELRTIKSPEVWSQVLENFKKKPSILMDLIPLE